MQSEHTKAEHGQSTPLPSSPHWAVSAIDGRYAATSRPLAGVASESALNLYRVRIEAAWLLHLATCGKSGSKGASAVGLTLPPAVQSCLEKLACIHADSPEARQAAERIKEFERTTNHDVKAVEYYVRDALQRAGADAKILAFVHFACTSEDINNIAYAMMQRDITAKVFLPAMERIDAALCLHIKNTATLPMLARTHGQTASPTTLGKEIAVFAHRLRVVRGVLGQIKIGCKFSGAVGNYNAHVAAFADIDWPSITRSFIEERLGFAQNPLTTQIENHDSIVIWSNTVRHYNSILIGLTRDFWSYISLGYFAQVVVATETGSSTMPHKVNPIDFENAEGNLGVANALAEHFANKLPISRWQRDLSDSTVLRTIGTFAGHSLLAWEALLRGLAKVTPDTKRISRDIDEAWEVLAEPIQTVMRAAGIPDAYERLKHATRGAAVTREALHALIDKTSELTLEQRNYLLSLTPANYTGYAAKLANEFLTKGSR